MSDEAINAHKKMAMDGVGSGPTMASTQGAKYDHPPSSAPLGDAQRAHPGRGGKATPSAPGDVSHGHKWGK